jgi:hypothetical protein
VPRFFAEPVHVERVGDGRLVRGNHFVDEGKSVGEALETVSRHHPPETRIIPFGNHQRANLGTLRQQKRRQQKDGKHAEFPAIPAHHDPRDLGGREGNARLPPQRAEQLDGWQIALSGGQDKARGPDQMSLGNDAAKGSAVPVIGVAQISRGSHVADRPA